MWAWQVNAVVQSSWPNELVFVFVSVSVFVFVFVIDIVFIIVFVLMWMCNVGLAGRHGSAIFVA